MSTPMAVVIPTAVTIIKGPPSSNTRVEAYPIKVPAAVITTPPRNNPNPDDFFFNTGRNPLFMSKTLFNSTMLSPTANSGAFILLKAPLSFSPSFVFTIIFSPSKIFQLQKSFLQFQPQLRSA